MNTNQEILLLLSGGVDSTALLHFYHDMGRQVGAMFVNYGQPAQAAEAEAARLVAENYSTPLHEVEYKGEHRVTGGKIEGRNLLLLSLACFEASLQTKAIAIGVHAGTGYSDCEPEFMSLIDDSIQLSTGQRVKVKAPFLSWEKSDVLGYCISNGVPIEVTYSCERGSTPCKECRSCRDRAQLC